LRGAAIGYRGAALGYRGLGYRAAALPYRGVGYRTAALRYPGVGYRRVASASQRWAWNHGDWRGRRWWWGTGYAWAGGYPYGDYGYYGYPYYETCSVWTGYGWVNTCYYHCLADLLARARRAARLILKSWAIRRSKPHFDPNHFPQSAYGRLVLIAEKFNGSWEVRMPIEFENHVVFDGVVLTGWANDGDQRIRCFVPRQTIGEIQGFTHAPPSEILRRTHEIFERLKPTFIRKIECKQLDASTVPTVTICSRDLHSTR